MTLQRWLQGVAAWAVPARCPLCSTRCSEDEPVCAGCRSDLVANAPCCARCAEPLPRQEPLCGRCLRRPPPFEATWAAFRYAWPLDGLVTRFKFGGDLAAGRTLARLVAQTLPPEFVAADAVLVPVPLHPKRLRQRGYDQALELARDLSRLLQRPLQRDLLQRLRHTPAQTELDARGRRRNVRGAFAVDARLRDRVAPGVPLLLVDDVMTTGSTLAECARVLVAAGLGPVRVLVVARAPARS